MPSRAFDTVVIAALLASLAAACTGEPPHPPDVPAPHLRIVSSPESATAGEPFEFVVAVEDAAGQRVMDAVEVTLGASEGLAQPPVATTVDGLATFPGVLLSRSGSILLTASAAGLEQATAIVEVAPAAPRSLAFTVQPTGGAAGPMLPVEVSIEDDYGNVVTSATTTVTVAIESDSELLLGATSLDAVNGVATFSDLRVEKAASEYRLLASADGLAVATSEPFEVIPASPLSFVFLSSFDGAVVGIPLAPFGVAVEDVYGNRAAPSATVEIGSGGLVVSGTLSRALVNGIARFDDLVFQTESQYAGLVAFTRGIVSIEAAFTPMFVVAPAGSGRLGIDVQPSSVLAGELMSPAVVVAALDGYGNRLPDATGVVWVADPSPVGPGVHGTTYRPFVNGVATFDDLWVSKAGQGWRLRFEANGFLEATSASFDVAPGAPSALMFAVEPSYATIRHPVSPAVVVAVADSCGNHVLPSEEPDVTVSLEPNAEGATLTGTTTRRTSGGLATFDDVVPTKVSGSLKIRATASGLSDAVSKAFAVTEPWFQTGPPGGSFVAVAVHPADLDRYALTFGSVWKSAGQWTRVTPASFVEAVAMNAIAGGSAGHVYLGTDEGAWVTEDGAATWARLPAAPWPVTSFAIDRTSPMTILAGTRGAGLHLSTDGGVTWSASAGVAGDAVVRAVAIDRENPAIVFAAVQPAAPGEGLVMRSDDGGATFVSTGLSGVAPIALLISYPPHPAPPAPPPPNAVFAGTEGGGLWRSADGGTTWSQVTAMGTATEVRSLAFGDGYTTMVYAATPSEVWRSADDGATWETGSLAGYQLPGGIVALAYRPGYLLAATELGLYYSPDDGHEWFANAYWARAVNVTVVATGVPGTDVVLVGAYGLWCGENGGQYFTRGKTPLDDQVWNGIAASSEYSAYAAGSAGLYHRSYPCTWSEVVGGVAFTAVAVHPAAYGRVVATAADGNVWSTEDGWWKTIKTEAVAAPAPHLNDLALDPNDVNVVVVAADEGVWRKTSSAAWAQATGITGRVLALARDPSPPALYAASTDGVFASSDGGATWSLRGSVALDDLVAVPGALYGTRRAGGSVLVSRDGAATWTRADEGLWYPGVTSIAVKPGSSLDLYVGTRYGGVFRTRSGGE